MKKKKNSNKNKIWRSYGRRGCVSATTFRERTQQACSVPLLQLCEQHFSLHEPLAVSPLLISPTRDGGCDRDMHVMTERKGRKEA